MADDLTNYPTEIIIHQLRVAEKLYVDFTEHVENNRDLFVAFATPELYEEFVEKQGILADDIKQYKAELARRAKDSKVH